MDDLPLRRKLIKGSLAAPLVLTVGKAGATARTTFSACLSKGEHRPEPEHVVAEPDETFRVSRDVLEVHSRDGSRKDKGPKTPEDLGPKKPDDPWLKKQEKQYVLGWDNQTLYRIDGSRLVPQQGDFSRSSLGRQFDIELRPTGKKVEMLAHLDETGNVVGIGPQTNGGQWTTKRCYSSLVGVHEDDAPRRYRWWG